MRSLLRRSQAAEISGSLSIRSFREIVLDACTGPPAQAASSTQDGSATVALLMTNPRLSASQQSLSGGNMRRIVLAFVTLLAVAASRQRKHIPPGGSPSSCRSEREAARIPWRELSPNGSPKSSRRRSWWKIDPARAGRSVRLPPRARRRTAIRCFSAEHPPMPPTPACSSRSSITPRRTLRRSPALAYSPISSSSIPAFRPRAWANSSRSQSRSPARCRLPTATHSASLPAKCSSGAQVSISRPCRTRAVRKASRTSLPVAFP